jgi:hypothetical protein
VRPCAGAAELDLAQQLTGLQGTVQPLHVCCCSPQQMHLHPTPDSVQVRWVGCRAEQVHHSLSASCCVSPWSARLHAAGSHGRGASGGA